jgi:hypothetical protein
LLSGELVAQSLRPGADALLHTDRHAPLRDRGIEETPMRLTGRLATWCLLVFAPAFIACGSEGPDPSPSKGQVRPAPSSANAANPLYQGQGTGGTNPLRTDTVLQDNALYTPKH